MKLNIKTKAQKTIQRNLRMPVSLNQQMDETSKLADELGADYHATLLSIIEQFNIEFTARLRDMKIKGESYTTFGITAGSESIPEPVEPSTAIAEANGISPLDRISIPNGAEQKRA